MESFKAVVVFTTLYAIIQSLSTFADNQPTPSTFYDDIDILTHSCSVEFQIPRKLDCACVTGLWILYGSCFENVTIMGDTSSKCHKLNRTPISKAAQVLRHRDDLAALSLDGDVKQLEAENAHNLELNDGWVLITGTDWTIVDSAGARVCISVIEPESYCYFSNGAKLPRDIVSVEKGCKNFDYFVDPEKCVPIGGHDENICDLAASKTHNIVRRDADAAATTAPEGHDLEIINITQDNEDFSIIQDSLNATNDNGTRDVRHTLADAILEVMDHQLDDLLGLRDTSKSASKQAGFKSAPKSGSAGRKKRAAIQKEAISIEEIDSNNKNPLNLTYTNPAYEFLETAKRIMLKTCPPFYVKPAFLNLAVSVFIKLQQTQFKLTEHTPNGFRRILADLRKCEKVAQQFNFTRPPCDGKGDGMYFAYGQTHELVLPPGTIDFHRDPIVDTVWNVFVNAHSYCYPHFRKPLDHHRFTTLMVPLFQNQMNDIWSQGQITEKSFDGLYGNQVEVQENLAYCTTSTRLDSSYPFDLPRPHRVPEFGAIPHHGNTTTGRRKRDVTLDSILQPVNAGSCMDATKPVLCADHVQSLVSQL